MAIENRGPELTVVCCTLIVTAVIAVLLRCYVRSRLVKNFGFDDWTMVAALISFIILIAVTLCGVHYGTGRHSWDLEHDDIKQALMFWWHCYYWYSLTMILCKVSIASFLLRIALFRLERAIIYSATFVTILTGAIFFFITIFQCHPVSFFWNTDQPGTCIKIDTIISITYAYSAFSVVCDFTFALLPIALIWQLNIDRRSKIALIPIMMMACVASSAVVVRLFYVQDFRSSDFLYATLDIAIWSTAEAGLAITAGSLATLRPLLRLISRKLGLSSPGPTDVQDSPQPRSKSENRNNLRNSNGQGFHDSLFSLSMPGDRDAEDKTMAHDVDLERNAVDSHDAMWAKHEQDHSNESEEEHNIVPIS